MAIEQGKSCPTPDVTRKAILRRKEAGAAWDRRLLQIMDGEGFGPEYRLVTGKPLGKLVRDGAIASADVAAEEMNEQDGGQRGLSVNGGQPKDQSAR